MGKEIDSLSARYVEREEARVRLPLTWAMLSQGRRVVGSRVDGGYLLWFGLAVSYFFWCIASELWAYADGQVHTEFCLTRNSLTFLHEGMQIAFENRSAAAALQVRRLASKSGQYRAGRTIAQTRLVNVREMGGASMGAFKALVELLDVHPQLPGEAPLTIRGTSSGWRVSTRTEAVAPLR